MSGAIVVGLLLAPLILAALVYGWRSPMYRLLPAYAALLPYGSGLALPLGIPTRYTSLSSLVGFALMAALTHRLISGSRGVRTVPASAGIWLMLLGLTLASFLWSIAPAQTTASLLSFAAVVLLYLLLTFSDIDRVAMRRTETAALLGGVVACCYGLYQAFTGTLPRDGPESAARFGIDLVGDNHIAAALLIPLAVALDRAANREGTTTRILHGAAVLIIFSGIILSGSRGGLIGSGLVFAIILLNSRRRTLMLAIGSVATVAVVAILAFQPADIGKRQAGGDSSGRTDIWRVGVAACDTYCPTGAGWGTFPDVYEETQASVPDAAVQVRGSRFEPHNNWLLIGIETGVAGLLLLTLGFGLALFEGFRLPRRVRGAPLGALLGVMFTGVLLSNFEFKYFWFALVFVMLARHAVDQDGAPTGTAPVPVPRSHEIRVGEDRWST